MDVGEGINGIKKQKIKIMWADNETSEYLLGFKVHVNLLVDVIKDDTVPVTFGVFGNWESGTSSIFKILEEELTGGNEDGFKDW